MLLSFVEEWLRSLHDYEIVVPQRIDHDGNLFPHHRHYLRKRSVGDNPTFYDDATAENLSESSSAGNNSSNVTNSTNSDTNDDTDESGVLLYSIHAFGRTIVLELESDEDISAPHVLFEEYDADGGEAHLLPREQFNAHCLHRGRIRREIGGPEEEESDVVLSLCHNMVSNLLLFIYFNFLFIYLFISLLYI